jgi:purine-nucleoside phosphorylase
MTDAYGYAQIQAAAAAIRERLGKPEGSAVAKVGLVLGSGLGAVGDQLLDAGGQSIHYGEITHFPTSGVVGHKGRLVFAEHEGTPALVLQGRVHAYEGWPKAAVVFPIRVLMALGCERIVLTNAAGGLQDGMTPGDLMLIEDHLNLTGDNPLVGENDDRLGARFPDMSDTYTAALRETVLEVAKGQGLALKKGVYAGLLGPSYETPAEIKMLRTLGASAVGMSTVYEAIAASHGKADVVGISCITNLAAGISANKLSHDEVKETASMVEKAFAELVMGLISRLG